MNTSEDAPLEEALGPSDSAEGVAKTGAPIDSKKDAKRKRIVEGGPSPWPRRLLVIVGGAVVVFGMLWLLPSMLPGDEWDILLAKNTENLDQRCAKISARLQPNQLEPSLLQRIKAWCGELTSQVQDEQQKKLLASIAKKVDDLSNGRAPDVIVSDPVKPPQIVDPIRARPLEEMLVEHDAAHAPELLRRVKFERISDVQVKAILDWVATMEQPGTDEALLQVLGDVRMFADLQLPTDDDVRINGAFESPSDQGEGAGEADVDGNSASMTSDGKLYMVALNSRWGAEVNAGGFLMLQPPDQAPPNLTQAQLQEWTKYLERQASGRADARMASLLQLAKLCYYSLIQSDLDLDAQIDLIARGLDYCEQAAAASQQVPEAMPLLEERLTHFTRRLTVRAAGAASAASQQALNASATARTRVASAAKSATNATASANNAAAAANNAATAANNAGVAANNAALSVTQAADWAKAASVAATKAEESAKSHGGGPAATLNTEQNKVLLTSIIRQLKELRARFTRQADDDGVSLADVLTAVSQRLHDKDQSALTIAQVAQQDIELRNLVYGVVDLQIRALPAAGGGATGVTMTRRSVEGFLARLDLPRRKSLLDPGDVHPPQITASQHARHQQLFRELEADLAFVDSILAPLGPNESIQPDAAPGFVARVHSILYSAVQLEARRLIADIRLDPGSGRSYAAAQKSSAALAQTANRLGSEFAALQQAQHDIAENTAQLKRAKTELASSIGQLQTELATSVDKVQAELARQQQADREQRAALEGRLKDDMEKAVAKPRMLPPEQLGTLADGVAARLLGTFAQYGYTVPTSKTSPDASTPRVAPLVDEANPVLAQQLYTSGRSAYFDDGSGQLDEAVSYFEGAARHDPRNIVYRYYLGLALYRAGRLNEASAQVRAVRAEENTRGKRDSVNRALERVQGPERTWLEKTRWGI